MSIADELQAELEDAIRNKDRARSNVIRSIRTEVAQAKAEPGFSGDVDDDLYVRVIGAYAKRMDKARREYEGLGERGEDMVARLSFELDYLARWLPQKLGEDETRVLVRETIAEIGEGETVRPGQVVGRIMKTHPGELDGALVNRLVREELGGG